MLTLVGAFFLIHLGSVPPHTARLSFRAEAHRAALKITQADVLVGRVGGDGGERGLDLPLLFGAGPVNGPLRAAYRPREWVAAVTRQLNVSEHPLGRAALWLSGIPVDLDARASRLYVRLTLKGF